jgi:hypothetical protein
MMIMMMMMMMMMMKRETKRYEASWHLNVMDKWQTANIFKQARPLQ